MLSILGSSSTTRTRAVRSPLSAFGSEATDTVDLIIRFTPSLARDVRACRASALFESEREIGIRQIARPTQPARAALAVLRVELAAAGLLLQILRQVRRI